MIQSEFHVSHISPAPMPSVDGAKMGGTCELQVNALSGLSVAKLDGVCYDNKVTDRICCKNAGVLGKSDSDGGAVTIRQSCQANQYCCAVKAFLDKVKEVNVLC